MKDEGHEVEGRKRGDDVVMEVVVVMVVVVLDSFGGVVALTYS